MLTKVPVQQQLSVEPAAFPDVIRSPSLITSPSGEWEGLTLQHFQSQPGNVQSSALRDHLLVVYIGGSTLIERGSQASSNERRWAHCGYICVVPAGYPLDHALKTRSDMLLIHLSPRLVSTLAHEAFGAAQAELRPRLAVRDETLHQVARLLLKEVEAGPSSDSILMAAHLGRTLAMGLLRRHSTLSESGAEELPALPQDRVGRVIEHMRAHLDQPLPLARLAAVAGLSHTHFAHAFRYATGQPPHRYLLQLRIEEARRLLAQTDDPIIQVGMQCGFESPTHLATTFRKATGMSPREWRAANRG